MPKRRQRPYAAEFRQQVVDLVLAGRDVVELAKQFTLSPQTIRTWAKRAELDSGKRTDGLTSAEREELRQLRLEVRRLKIDREILSKAAAWFARETDSKPKGSSNS